jgi:hypothetical protein
MTERIDSKGLSKTISKTMRGAYGNTGQGIDSMDCGIPAGITFLLWLFGILK